MKNMTQERFLAAHVPPGDLDKIVSRLETFKIREQLSDEQILLTGGTGFFGKWLTLALLDLNDQLELNNQITIVTRDAHRAIKNLPWLERRSDVDFIEQDIRDFNTNRTFSTIIHGAATASQDLNENKPDEMFDTIIEGTRRILKVAEKCRRIQFVSSGAVYGPQPHDIDNVPETYLGAPSTIDFRSAYGEAKRASEFLCSTRARQFGFHLSIARCFAFLGAFLPIDTHFAAGNFMKCVLEGTPIHIAGDGTPRRSYLYAADLVVWLLAILIADKKAMTLNVGSGQSISILELAQAAHHVGCEIDPTRASMKNPIIVAQKPAGIPPLRYVPSVQAAERELGLIPWTSLHDGLSKTLQWHARK